MDLKLLCRFALALLVLQSALVFAAEPASGYGDSVDADEVLSDEESDFVEQDARPRSRVALIERDTTDSESLTPVEVSQEEYCDTEVPQYEEPLYEESYGTVWNRGLDRVDDWLSSQVCQEPTWFTGAEFSFVDIDARTGGRITLSQTDTTAPGLATVSILDGDGLNETGHAPRLWVGRRIGDKWAVQARYWSLSQNLSRFPDQLAPPTGTNFATFSEIDRMNASTFDIEAVRRFETGDWKIDAIVGGRYANFGVESQLHAFGVFTTGHFTNLILSNGCEFEGTGVTYGLMVRRPIGDTHAHVYFGARGASLSGQSDSFGRSAGAVVSNPSTPLSGAATVRRNNADSDLFITEIQLGVEWNYALSTLPANFFFRTGYEYQDWNLVGPATGGAGFGGTIGELTTNSFSRAGLGDMQLHGISIASGLTW